MDWFSSDIRLAAAARRVIADAGYLDAGDPAASRRLPE